jgi:hypothetical protein
MAIYTDANNEPGDLIAYACHNAVWSHGLGEYDFPVTGLTGNIEAGRYYWITAYADAGDVVYTGRCGSVCFDEGDSLKMGANNVSEDCPPPDGGDFNFSYNPNCYAWSVWMSDGSGNGDVTPPDAPTNLRIMGS